MRMGEGNIGRHRHAARLARLVVGIVTTMAACQPSTPRPADGDRDAPSSSVRPDEPAPAAEPEGAQAPERFEATLRIDPEPGAKQFQGVWVERDDGQRWVVDYRARGWWMPFDGRRVRVSGRRYEPRGEAITATHFRVHELALVAPKGEPIAILTEVHEEQELEGVFEVETWPAGTKLAGERDLVFVATGGERYRLANDPGSTIEDGRSVRIVAREVVMSPFVAHVGGRHLWLIQARPIERSP